MLSQQRFFDVQEAADKVHQHIENNDVIVHPERFTKQFDQWLETIRPWCISRQLWWGHRIPVWYDDAGNQWVFDEDRAVHEDQPAMIRTKIIFNLIADSRLENPFTIEQLIDLLLQPSLTPHRGRLRQVYTHMYRTKYAQNTSLIKQIDQIESIFAPIDTA